MKRILKNKGARTGVFFGATSGVITTIGLIAGLNAGTKSLVAVLGGILVVAVADAMSDAMGIHLAQEADPESTHDVTSFSCVPASRAANRTRMARRSSGQVSFQNIFVIWKAFHGSHYCICCKRGIINATNSISNICVIAGRSQTFQKSADKALNFGI